jgi:hypothetical protein
VSEDAIEVQQNVTIRIGDFLERHIRSVADSQLAAVAQLVERVLGKDEVMGSSPISSSSTDWMRTEGSVLCKKRSKVGSQFNSVMAIQVRYS